MNGNIRQVSGFCAAPSSSCSRQRFCADRNPHAPSGRARIDGLTYVASPASLDGRIELEKVAMKTGGRDVELRGGVVAKGSSLVLQAGKRTLTLKADDLEHYKGERGRRGNKLPRGFQRVDQLLVE